MKSMGGSNDSENLVGLTAKEHFVAHLLLWKIHKNESAAFAFMMMCNSNNPQRKLISSRYYEEARKAAAIKSVDFFKYEINPNAFTPKEFEERIKTRILSKKFGL